MKRKLWTEKQVEYLKQNYEKKDTDVICRRLRKKPAQVYRKAMKLGLRKPKDYYSRAGRKGAQHPVSVARRWKKGHTPFNKGKHIEEFMSAEGITRSSRTRFQKGHHPVNTKPIGYERTGTDGYIYIKVAMGRKMVLKHRWLWAQTYGEVPDGYCVAFRDGNRSNCEIGNLYLLSRVDSALRLTQNESLEKRQQRVAKCQATRNKTIRRDRVRIHWGLEPKSKIVKRW